MRYALKVAYDGTEYCGWQLQPNGMTVQQRMQEALLSMTGEKIAVVASGRTDSGVHAKGQVCAFDCEKKISPRSFVTGLNFLLPDDIAVLECAEAPADFDPVRAAKRKTYVYRMFEASVRNPFEDRYSALIRPGADIEKMARCGKMFEGVHDFSAYCAAKSSAETFEREIYDVSVSAYPHLNGRMIEISVTGNGFLYKMVRTISGTMLYYSLGKIGDEEVSLSLSTGERRYVGKTMPPRGLTLERVEYERDPFSK